MADVIVIDCASCGRRSLLPLTMLTSFERTTESGRVVYRLAFTCWCGRPGSKQVVGPASEPA